MTWRRLFYWAGIALGSGLFAYQLGAAWQALVAQPAAFVAPWLLLGVLGLDLLAYLLLMAGWAAIMDSVGAPLPGRLIVQGYLISFLPRYIPGTIWGYLSRSEWLAERAGVPYSRSSLASLLEVALQVLTALAVAAVYLAPPLWRLPAALASLAAGAVAWRAVPMLLSRAAGGIPRETHTATWRGWFAAVSIYLIFWCTHGLATWLAAAALGAGTQISWFAATFAFSAAWLIGFLVILAPAGLGVREWTLVALLERAGSLPGWQPPLIAVVTRLGIVVAELILLAVGLNLYAADWRQNRSKERIRGLVK